MLHSLALRLLEHPLPRPTLLPPRSRVFLALQVLAELPPPSQVLLALAPPPSRVLQALQVLALQCPTPLVLLAVVPPPPQVPLALQPLSPHQALPQTLG